MYYRLLPFYLLGTADGESDFLTFNKVVIEKLLLNVLGSQCAEDKLLVIDRNLDASALLRLDLLTKRGLQCKTC
jgi:hypothetical protein